MRGRPLDRFDHGCRRAGLGQRLCLRETLGNLVGSELTRMEDDRDVFRHHLFGQRIDDTIAQLHIKNGDIGLGLLISEHC